MVDTEEESAANPQGPAYRCRNGDCEYLKPTTTVHESERKTVYRCPGCRRGLHIDWKEDDQ